MNDILQRHLDALVRLKFIIGDPAIGTPAIVQVSAASWWAGVKTGKYPPSVKLGPRTTAWRLSEVIRLVETGDWRDPATAVSLADPSKTAAPPAGPDRAAAWSAARAAKTHSTPPSAAPQST